MGGWVEVLSQASMPLANMPSVSASLHNTLQKVFVILTFLVRCVAANLGIQLFRDSMLWIVLLALSLACASHLLTKQLVHESNVLGAAPGPERCPEP